MNHLLLLLFAFVALGLARDRLGWKAYVLMSLVIVAYVAYGYHAGR